jgi:hypothetical protein
MFVCLRYSRHFLNFLQFKKKKSGEMATTSKEGSRRADTKNQKTTFGNLRVKAHYVLLAI